MEKTPIPIRPIHELSESTPHVPMIDQEPAQPIHQPLPNQTPISIESEYIFNRPPRILRELPKIEVDLPSPPQRPNPLRMNMLMILAPLLTSGIYVLMFFIRGASGSSAWMMIPIIGISGVSAGISIFNYRSQKQAHEQAVLAAESSFTEALSKAGERLEQLDQKQFSIRRDNDPEINTVFDVIRKRDLRLWERRTQDDDFMVIRVGLGQLPSLTTIKLEKPRYTTPDTLRLQNLQQKYINIRDVPITINLRTLGSLGIVGKKPACYTTVHALIWQICTHHSADDVRICAFWNFFDDDTEWNWLQFLPHTQNLSGDNSYRLLAHTDFQKGDKNDKRPAYLQQVLEELQQELNRRLEIPGKLPHLVVILPHYKLTDPMMAPIQTILSHGTKIGASVLFVVEGLHDVPGDCGVYLDLTQSPQLVARTGHAPVGGTTILQMVDQVDSKRSEAAAEILNKIKLVESTGNQQMPRGVDFFTLLVEDPKLVQLMGNQGTQAFSELPNYQPVPLWEHLPPTNKDNPSGLRAIPIGKSSGSEGPKTITYLNLNEKQEGVHGMIAGTTGSGKSELLTTFLLGLAILHHPHRLNFMLIDFKGGATFEALAKLPHTSGYITDLSGSQAQRALTAINSELDRRKRGFAEAGVANIRDYRLLPPSNRKPIPNLLIAIDEFDEMVNDHEEVVEELIRVAKQGRSLGVHLLFATQQPSNSKIKAGLKANLTYWLSLRVVDPEDSKLMIGNKEAALISNTTPGRAYKRIDKNQPVLFQSALATAPYREADQDSKVTIWHIDETGRKIPHQEYQDRIRSHTTMLAKLGKPDSAIPEATQNPNREKSRSQADVMIQVLHKALPSEAHAFNQFHIWEPPLESNIVLASLINVATSHALHEDLRVQVGYIDNPSEAKKDPLFINFQKNGSTIIIGSAGSGKTSALRTCILALATLYSPAELMMYSIDKQGNGLGFWAPDAQSAAIPHLADRISTSNTLKIERLLAILDDTIQERAKIFQQAGVETLAAYYLKAHQTTTVTTSLSDSLPAVVVWIDGLQDFAEYNQDLLKPLTDIIRAGHAYGIYVVSTTDRFSSVLPADLKNSIPTRWVLRLNTEDDSTMLLNKPFAARINPDHQGRGYIQATPLPREFQIALPSLNMPLLDSSKDALAEVKQYVARFNFGSELKFASQYIFQKWNHYAHTDRTIKLLPSDIKLDLQHWSKQAIDLTHVPIALGRDNRTDSEMSFDLARTPHFMVAGGPASGKNNTIRLILGSLVSRYTPEQLSLYIVDFRNYVLQSFVSLPHTRGYASDIDTLNSMLTSLKQDLSEQASLALHGPLTRRVVLVCPNIDLLDNPQSLDSINRWVIQGQRIGVHCVVAARDYSSLGSSKLIKGLRQERSAIMLGSIEQQLNNLGFNPREINWPAALDPTPGRGFLAQRGQVQFGQFWRVDEDELNTQLQTLYPVPVSTNGNHPTS